MVFFFLFFFLKTSGYSNMDTHGLLMGVGKEMSMNTNYSLLLLLGESALNLC